MNDTQDIKQTYNFTYDFVYKNEESIEASMAKTLKSNLLDQTLLVELLIEKETDGFSYDDIINFYVNNSDDANEGKRTTRNISLD